MAAHKLVEEWPSLFQFDRDYPTLEAFRPEKPMDPETAEPTEENLQKFVRKKEVRNAVTLYKRMHSEKVELSEEAKVRWIYSRAHYESIAIIPEELL